MESRTKKERFKAWLENKKGALRIVPALVVILVVGLLGLLFFGQTFKIPLSSAASKPRIFVTSTTYNGNLGGSVGADAKCQERADSVGLGSSWKAWISDEAASASARLIHFSTPYSLVNGTKIAENWDDLTDKMLQNSINITEKGEMVTSGYAWTGTSSKGDSLGKNFHCNNWTSGDQILRGGTGVTTLNTTSWSYIGSDTCIKQAALYCFEQ